MKIAVGRFHRCRQIGGKGEASFAHVARDQIGKSGLENGNVAALEGGNLAAIAVDARQRVTKIGKACARDQADVTRADHCNAHASMSLAKAVLCKVSDASPWFGAAPTRSHGLAPRGSVGLKEAMAPLPGD